MLVGGDSVGGELLVDFFGGVGGSCFRTLVEGDLFINDFLGGGSGSNDSGGTICFRRTYNVFPFFSIFNFSFFLFFLFSMFFVFFVLFLLLLM